MSREERVDIAKIPIECPNPKCGEPGFVPLNRIDRQLVCRACGERFYMDAHGSRLVLGERPPDLGVDKSSVISYKKSKPLLIERFERKWLMLPDKARTWIKRGTALGVFAVVIVYLVLPATTGGRIKKFPKDLEGRARALAQAFVKNDRASIRAIAATNPNGEVDAWVDKVRPKAWGDDPKQAPVMEINTHVVSQNPKRGQAIVSVEIGEAAPAPTPAPPPQEPEAAPAEEGTEAMPAPEGTEPAPAPTPDAAEAMPAPEGAAPEEKPAPGPGEGGGDDAASPEAHAEPAGEAPAQPAQGDDSAAAEAPQEAMEAEPAAAPAKPKLRLMLYWTKTENGWLFDPVETLRVAN